MPEPRLLTKPDALSIFRSSTSGTAIFTAIGRISKTHRRGIRSLSISGTSSGTLSLCIIDFSLNIHANTFAARLRQLSQTELVGREIPDQHRREVQFAARLLDRSIQIQVCHFPQYPDPGVRDHLRRQRAIFKSQERAAGNGAEPGNSPAIAVPT
jgi:hypothetical protein